MQDFGQVIKQWIKDVDDRSKDEIYKDDPMILLGDLLQIIALRAEIWTVDRPTINDLQAVPGRGLVEFKFKSSSADPIGSGFSGCEPEGF